jgi:LmbE family N-acetylglucosaminyl deacetylase
MIVFAFVGAALFAVVALGAALIVMRHSAYRRQQFCEPSRNHVLGVAGPAIETIPVEYQDEGFVLPSSAGAAVSGLLELQIRTTVQGRLSDPAVEICAGDFSDVQYLERAASGARFLNVSRLLSSAGPQDKQIQLRGRRVILTRQAARLHLCSESISADDRVLVISPHPDDAEIAAFGLYADTCGTVVTLTAGDASDRYRSPGQPWNNLSARAVAKMRVWDSLTVPQLGDIPPQRVANLGFPDGRLSAMHAAPDRDFVHVDGTASDFGALRELNRSPLVRKRHACTWKSLVDDLSEIISETRPTIIVAPHPQLDSHPDHLFSTVAVTEALDMNGSARGRMFFYTVHNRHSELWPFGPAGSGVAFVPLLPEDGVCGSGFYSHALSHERQQQKFIALEAMHDVRDLQWPEGSARQRLTRMLAEARGVVRGVTTSPSYLRRAIRPDELFLVASHSEAKELTRRAMEQGACKPAAA